MKTRTDKPIEDVEMNAPDTTRQAVDRSLQTWCQYPGPLLPVLHDVHNELGWIPPEAISLIADGLNLSHAEVHGVVTFYHYFRSSPPGQNVIRICRAEACQAMGARTLEATTKGLLGVEYGQTTVDGRFTLEPVYCLGNCACAPAISVNEKLYGRVTEHTIAKVLTEYGDE